MSGQFEQQPTKLARLEDFADEQFFDGSLDEFPSTLDDESMESILIHEAQNVKSGSKDQHDALPILDMDKFLVRPDSSGHDIAFGFTLAPKKLTKRSLTNKTLRSIHTTHSEVLNEMKSVNDNTVGNEGGCAAGSIDTIASFSVSTPNLKQSSDEQLVTLPENTDDDCIMHTNAPDTVAIQKAPVEAESCSDTQNCPVSQGRNTSYASESTTISQRPFNITDYVHQDIAANKSSTALDNRQSSPTANEQSINSLDRESVSCGPPHTVDFDHQAKLPHNSARTHETTNMIHASGSSITSTSKNAPSEEDLLYLLMHRSRLRDRRWQKDHARLNDLETERSDLQGQVTILKHKLEVAVAEGSNSWQRADQTRKEFDHFKRKYSKLKTWALEMNKEYTEICRTGAEMKSAIASLRLQSKDIQEPVREALLANNVSVARTAAFRNDVQEAKKVIEVAEGNYREARTTIARRESELQALRNALKAADAKHQALLQQVEKVDKSSTLNAQQLSQNLELLHNKLDKFSKLQPVKSDNVEFLRILHNLVDGNVTTHGELSAMCADISTITGHVKGLRTLIDTESMKHSNGLVFEKFLEDSLLIQKIVDALKPDLERLQELEQSNVRLEERAVSEAAIRQLIEQTREFAEAGRTELQRSHDKLVDSLTAHKENEINLEHRAACDYQRRFEDLTTKLSITSSDLYDVKSRLQISEGKLMAANAQLEDSRKTHATLQREHRVKIEQELDQARISFESKQKQTESAFNSRLQQSEELVTAADHRSKTLENELRLSRKDTTDLQEANENLSRAFQQQRDEIQITMRSLDEQRKTNDDLLCKIKEMQILESQVLVLQGESADKTKIASDLETTKSRLQDARSELESLRLENQKQTAEIDRLEEKQSVLQQRTCQYEEMQSRVNTYQETLAKQCEEILELQKSVEVIPGLEVTLQKKASELEKVNLSMNKLQIERDTPQEANTKAQRHEERILVLEAELDANKTLAQQIVLLEELNRQREDTINHLRKQAERSSQLEETVTKLHARIEEEVEHIAAQDAELSDLRNELHEKESLMDLRRVSIDEFFTQNTNISLENDLAHGQPVPSVLSELSHGNHGQQASMPVHSLDLSVLMKATPLFNAPESERHAVRTITQTTFVPDSQNIPFESDKPKQCLSNTKGANKTMQVSSSPLTDIDEECSDLDMEIPETIDDCEKESGTTICSTTAVDDIFDIPILSPPTNTRIKVLPIPAKRAASMISQDDMLLQESESGRKAIPRVRRPRAQPPVARTSTVRPLSKSSQIEPTQQITASSLASQASPHSRSQDQDSAEARQPQSNRSSEPNRPNSAVKRKAEPEIPADVRGRMIARRIRLGPPSSETRTSARSKMSANASQESVSNSQSHSGIRSGSSTGKKTGQKLKTTRGRQRQDRYSERFNGNEG